MENREKQTDISEADVLTRVGEDICAFWEKRFKEAERNLTEKRPVAAAAAKLVDGSLDVVVEVKRITGNDVKLDDARMRKPVLLLASKFGVWASELTLVAGTLLKAGYQVKIGTEDGSPPHFLSVSMKPDFVDGSWRASVVSSAEQALAFRFLNPESVEHVMLKKENIVSLHTLARPPQVGDYLKDKQQFATYAEALEDSLRVAQDYSALCIAGGSGAIPGFMFDRGLHSLILAFHRLGKPIMGECNGALAILQTLEPLTEKSILYGRAVTTHSALDEYQSGWGWTVPFEQDTDSFWRDGVFDLAAYSEAEQWYSPGTGGNPLIDSEGYFRAAVGCEGRFFSPAGSSYAVVVDGHFITCRTTPDGYPGALALISLLNNKDAFPSPFFMYDDWRGCSIA
jgi:putative intracellular protease/amidase